MRFAFLGDIHANLEALTVVLAELEKKDIDQYFCMGDIVGYGANPEECVNIIRDLGAITVAGNHDHAAIGKLDISYFNQYAKQAAIWTQDHISDDTKEFLGQLPLVMHTENFTMVHGSLQSPELFNYVQVLRDAEFNFEAMDKQFLFLGHSHQPLGFFNTDPMTYTLDQHVPIEDDSKTIVNVGSVGQPRDEDPRSAFAIYDDEKNVVDIFRVEYDIDTTARKIIDAGLPEALALRLSLGK